MKHLIILYTIVLLCSSQAHAGWFSKAPDPFDVATEKIVALENQITHKEQVLNRWQIAAGSMAILSVVFLITGTALGATTRKHHDHATTGRMGSPTSNGTRPLHVAKTPKANPPTSLAA